MKDLGKLLLDELSFSIKENDDMIAPALAFGGVGLGTTYGIYSYKRKQLEKQKQQCMQLPEDQRDSCLNDIDDRIKKLKRNSWTYGVLGSAALAKAVMRSG